MNLREKLSEFPLGLAPLIMIGLAVASAPVALRSSAGRQPGALRFWSFAKSHYEEFQQRLPEYYAAHPDRQVEMTLNGLNVMRDKLLASFLSGTGAPDLVEMEISSVSRFFAGRPEDCGFLDLKPYMERDGLYAAAVAARYSAWSNRGRIYGAPHDIHPVVLVYRYELVEPFGDLPGEVKTWDDFVRFFQKPGILDVNRDGKRDRYALVLDQASFFHARVMALQQQEGLFNERGEVVFDGPGHRWAFDFIRRCLYDWKIAKDAPATGQDLYASLDEGEVLCAVCPDWLIGNMARDYPQLAGRLKAMPLPAVKPGGLRTSTVGGTMIGIAKQSRSPDLAWEAIKFLYYDGPSRAARFRETRILPALKTCWTNPIFSEHDGFIADPPLGRLLIQNSNVPPFYQGRYGAEAAEEESKACSVGIDATPAEGYAALKRGADRIRELMRKDRFAEN